MKTINQTQLQNLIDRNNLQFFSIQTMDLNKIKNAIDSHKNNPDKNNLQKIENLFEEILKSIDKLKKELEFQRDSREYLTESLKNSEDELFSLSIKTQIKIGEKLTDNLNKMIEVEEMKKGILRGAIETHSMLVAINMTKKVVEEEKEYKNNFFVKNSDIIFVIYAIINSIASIFIVFELNYYIENYIISFISGLALSSVFSLLSLIISFKKLKKLDSYDDNDGVLGFLCFFHSLPIIGFIANFAVIIFILTEMYDQKED